MTLSDRFLSEEDLDLTSLPEEDFAKLSYAALKAAQASNEQDKHLYRNGCIAVEPGYEHLLPLVKTGAV